MRYLKRWCHYCEEKLNAHYLFALISFISYALRTLHSIITGDYILSMFQMLIFLLIVLPGAYVIHVRYKKHSKQKAVFGREVNEDNREE